MPKFDRDLLSVLLWSSANSVVTVGGSRVSQTQDQKYRAAKLVLCYLELFARICGTNVSYFR